MPSDSQSPSDPALASVSGYTAGQRVKIDARIPVRFGGALWRGATAEYLWDDHGMVVVLLPDGRINKYDPKYVKAV